ncbi:hypothetical protein EIN_283640 [Entamoeba invadens IP1]|uniref:Uncharacterized protein n=1 Tax=Entamoeba invadens IP1 TaxID=370355 RepID=L7FLS2_ENTIV|nr:hypothetical protein EIN_283640 [Entamoeba invadens IP1]ELP84818.1 hypothetical protein EIN_283640 [Entamoeba invadens IP1]|eukprot:XP_004184164.1 hypothetical protein EIN_283640 [Entamoeba invadens IP1]
MNFVNNLFEDIINGNVSGSSRLAVHASFIMVLLFEAYFFVMFQFVRIHLGVLFLITIGAYVSIVWVFYQLDNNETLKKNMADSNKIEEQQKTE